MLSLKQLCLDSIESPSNIQAIGKIISIQGHQITAQIPQAALGDFCLISRRDQSQLPSQVIGFSENAVTLCAFEELGSIAPGAEVLNSGQSLKLCFDQIKPGAVLDALARPLTEATNLDFRLASNNTVQVDAPPPSALSRRAINSPLETGISAIDALCTIGYGQRIGLFAGPGLGKSTLLGMIARNAKVDLSVIALVGERGREVQDFIEDVLGPEGLKRSILVVATSDEPAAKRALAVQTATAIAEEYRAQGKKVLLMVDSLTRVARAIRDLSLAAGELPVRQGYTPSVYQALPKLVERPGNTKTGSITAIYTVLTHAAEEQDALGEEVKSLLDGHLILSQELAERGIRPAIDLSSSISRLVSVLHSEQYLKQARTLVSIISRLKRDRDLLLLGAEPDLELKAAIEIEKEIISYLTQNSSNMRTLAESKAWVERTVGVYLGKLGKA